MGVDADVAERILAQLVENGCRYASSGNVSIAQRDGAFLIQRDGSGPPDGEREQIFEAGWRGADPENAAGAGLGLALPRRLARIAGGDAQAVDDASGRFTVRLPAG